MTYRWRILAASAALFIVAGFAGQAAAQFMPAHRNNHHYIPSFVPGVPGLHIPQNYYRPNYRVPTNRNVRRTPNTNVKKHSATEMVLQNLQVAQTDLEKKNTSDAFLQLKGSENILSNWKTYQIAADKVAADDVEKALKSVRDARSSLNSKKLDDASSSIADAVAALKTNNSNGNKKKNNNN